MKFKREDWFIDVSKLKNIIDRSIGVDWKLFSVSRDYIELVDILIIEDAFIEISLKNNENYFVFDEIERQKKYYEDNNSKVLKSILYFENCLIKELIKNDKGIRIYLMYKK